METQLAFLHDVTVVIARRRVLGPLHLAITTGEHWAVLGPNGAGKTTFLRLIGAERLPSAGQLSLFSRPVPGSDLRSLRRRIGLVGHAVTDRLAVGEAVLELVLTGRDGLLAPWWSSFDDDEKERAGDLLKRFGVERVATQTFEQCSQGERQRILLARALFGEPELLLLDEAALGMDLPSREALVQSLDELHESSPELTTVQVAHTLEELPTSLTHVLLLREGRVVASGPIATTLSDETLSACFGTELTVIRHDNGRLSAHAVGAW